MAKKTKVQRKPLSIEIHQTHDVHFVPYQMAKEFCLDELTEVHKDVPANQRLSKAVAKRLTLSVEEVTVESFNNNDGGVFIRIKIRGIKQDIDKVNKVLQARYDSDEQKDESE